MFAPCSRDCWVPGALLALLVAACADSGTEPAGAVEPRSGQQTAGAPDAGASGAACSQDSDCGASNFCLRHRCDSGECAVSFAANGTPLPDAEQKDGDCKKAVCDGAGQVSSSEDDGDTPTPSHECKQAVCAAGVPTELDAPDGQACAMGAGTCSGGACKLPPGHACTADPECKSGFCVDGVCCDGICDGICATCAIPGKVGVCSQVPPNTEDPATCEGTHACTGSPGGCKLKIGQSCGSNAQCITNNCGGSPATCQ